MARADLHVHSTYSAHPSTWFLQRLGTRESYVDPESVYLTARQAGMQFVTITDHNSIEGAVILKEKYPREVFVGVESTAYMPEDGTKIHLLIYGLNQKQFDTIEEIRSDIYQLRDFLKSEHLTHAVAHITFSINRKMSMEHIEKLLLLFDHFEGRNGSRHRFDNDGTVNVLSSLKPEHFEDMRKRHRIEPMSDTPWRKGVVGGSDDHSGLFIGTTYTIAQAATPAEFLNQIRNFKTYPGGRHSDYKRYAFAIYKVAYDFSQSRSRGLTSSIFHAVNSLVFDPEKLGLRKRWTLEKMKFSKSSKDSGMKKMMLELVETLQANGDMSVEEKLELLYAKIARIADEFFKTFLEPVGKQFRDGDFVGFVRSISGALPGIFLSAPFFTSIHFMHDSRELMHKMENQFEVDNKKRKKRVLWFTDTLTDLNGIAETLRKLATLARERNLELILVGSVIDGEDTSILPENVLLLPCIQTYTPSYFNTYTLRVPSVLESMKLIYEADPDEIFISTPGSIGILGLIASKLLHVPSINVYHTDFTRQARQIIGEESICNMVEDFTRIFYNLSDIISVPTKQYMGLLEKRGFLRTKMVQFKRGIDPNTFAPQDNGAHYLARSFGIKDGPTLLYGGRISKEKSMDFLGEVYTELAGKFPGLNLVLAGNGPYFEEFKERMAAFRRVYFPGRIARIDLAQLYSSADCFVFPSVTDTFGMVVLEAQACGLPAVVSDFGGPQEIIVSGQTGFVAKAHDRGEWVEKISGVLNMKAQFPELYSDLRTNARRHILSSYDWDLVLKDVFANKFHLLQDRKNRKHLAFDDIVMLEESIS
ncbi:MAG: glycosyltransferase [Chitinivibrionales bacterium]|nr:glycosyltransferase [Chitinivibrionales bacterium]